MKTSRQPNDRIINANKYFLFVIFILKS